MPASMRMEGIKGESKHPRHKGEMELLSVQLGDTRAVPALHGSGARESSAPSVSEIVVTKQTDKASQALFHAYLSGEGSDVTITFEQEKANHSLQAYLVIRLESTMVASYSTSTRGDNPLETLTLNFAKIAFTISPSGTGP